MAGIILSCDIGTSSFKAAFIDFDGRLVAFSRVAYRRGAKVSDVQTSGALAWQQAFIETIEKLHAQAPDCVPDGVCISGNGPTLVPVTSQGKALPPLCWHDGRMVFPEKEKSAPAASYEAPSFFLPHAAWLKKKAAAEYQKTSLFISSHEWLAHWLGARALTVLPQSSYEPYYWDEAQCRLFGLDREKFPPFIKMGSLMGRVSAKTASAVGPFCGNCLKSGTPIIAGGPDFITALIGTNTLRPADVCDRAGSSEGVNICVNSAAPGLAENGLRVLPHIREGLWNIGAIIPSSGRLFEWYRSFTSQDDRDYEEHLAELIPSPDDTEKFKTENFSRDNLFPRGLPRSTVPGDFEVAVRKTPQCPDKNGLGRAVLCAMGFAVRSALKTLEDRGLPVSEMKVSGGQGKNPRWNQLKADISGISLDIPEIPDGELAGNAVLAVSALDAAPSLEYTAGRMIRIKEVYKSRNTVFWEEQYRQFISGNGKE